MDQARALPPLPADPMPRRRIWTAATIALAAVGLTGIGVLLLGCLQAPQSEAKAEPSGSGLPRLFHSWPRDKKPDVVLLISGEVHGYMQPCGCSEPQFGGLERRYNFLQDLRTRGWPVVAVDVGDVAQHFSPQDLLKYKFTMEAMRQLGYTAAGIGWNETRLPLIDGLAEVALNPPSSRVVCANLLDREVHFPQMVAFWEVAAREGIPTVGVIGVVAPSVARLVKDPDVKFGPIAEALQRELPKIQAKNPEILVLLCEGSAEEARDYARQFPQFQVVVCLNPETEPPAKPEMVGPTMIVTVGHKGRYVGAVGAYRTGRAKQSLEFHYELVSLGPEYKTPPGKDADNPALELLERYAAEVKKRNYLAVYKRILHPIQQEPKYKAAKYVGSERCKKCHEESYKVWKDSPHSHAYASLEKATRPGLRQYDGECVVCHVTGFGHDLGFTDEVTTPLLKNNGCENCHGPASLHVKNPQDLTLNALMNPFKTPPNETPEQKTVRINRLDQSCQKCHDPDNDVHWKIDKWTTGHIEHKEPKGGG